MRHADDHDLLPNAVDVERLDVVFDVGVDVHSGHFERTVAQLNLPNLLLITLISVLQALIQLEIYAVIVFNPQLLRRDGLYEPYLLHREHSITSAVIEVIEFDPDVQIMFVKQQHHELLVKVDELLTTAAAAVHIDHRFMVYL